MLAPADVDGVEPTVAAYVFADARMAFPSLLRLAGFGTYSVVLGFPTLDFSHGLASSDGWAELREVVALLE